MYQRRNIPWCKLYHGELVHHGALVGQIADPRSGSYAHRRATRTEIPTNYELIAAGLNSTPDAHCM